MPLNFQAATGRRYEVLGPVGRGGFGTVYRADMLGDDGFKRVVALKILNDDVAKTGEIARRFRDEARVLGLLRHRAIVHVDGLVNLGERQALVMEFIDGADLARIMAIAPVPAEPALEIIGEVANALDVAFHTQAPNGQTLGLLHRDVKPSNIRITPVGEVKVLDFGVARAEFGSREAVTKSYLLGSNGYMGPERYEGEDGPPTDIYSLGVVMLEMLTGRAFGPTSIRPQKLAHRVNEALATVSGLSEPVKELVRQMMAFEPKDRPSAAEVERRTWDLRHGMKGRRLRDWAGEVVADAASKKVDAPEDDLTGHVLRESSQGPESFAALAAAAAPAPSRFEVPDPGLVTDTTLAPIPTKAGPQVEATPLPDVDEWDDDQPTVVGKVKAQRPTASIRPLGGPQNLATLVQSVPGAPPPALPVVTSRDVGPGRPGGAVSVPPPPRIPPTDGGRRRVSLVAVLVGIIAVTGVVGGAVVLRGPSLPLAVGSAETDVDVAIQPDAALTADAPVAGGTPDAVPTEGEPAGSPSEEPAPELSAPAPALSQNEGFVHVVGDAVSLRLVSVSGRRHAPGVLRPGAYLISADFGEGARMAGRIQLDGGQRITLDCSAAALACSEVPDL